MDKIMRMPIILEKVPSKKLLRFSISGL